MQSKTLTLTTALAMVVATAGLVTGAFAQEKGGGLGQACKSELASLCAADAKKGPFVCLKQNEAKLGAECAAYVKTAEERRTRFRAACDADRAKLCNNAKGGELVQCLRGKAADLSKPCSEALAALPAPTKKQ